MTETYMKRILSILPLLALVACDNDKPNAPVNYPQQVSGEYQQQGQPPYYPQQPAPAYYPQQQSGTSFGDIATGAAIGALLHRTFTGNAQPVQPTTPEVRYISAPQRQSIAPVMHSNTPIPVAKPTLVMPTRMLPTTPTTTKPSMVMPSRVLPPVSKPTLTMPSRTIAPATKFRPVTGSSFRAQPSRRK